MPGESDSGCPVPGFADVGQAASGPPGQVILLGDVGMARRIIDGDGSIDINGESRFGMHDTFLMLAAHVGPVAMVDLLLDRQPRSRD